MPIAPHQLITLFSAVPVADLPESAAEASVADLTALLLAHNFAPTRALAQALAARTPRQRAHLFVALLDALDAVARTTGAPTSPLYRAFPNHQILPVERRWIGRVLRSVGFDPGLDPDLYGADPATEHQNARFEADPDRDSLHTVALDRAGAARRSLRFLGPADQEFVADRTRALMESLTPLSAAETRFVAAAVADGALTPSDLAAIRFRDKLPLLRDTLDGADYAAACSSATDALRLAAALSGAPASLKPAPRLDLRTADAKRILALLERLVAGPSDHATDLLRHAEIWKRFAAHVRADKYATRWPQAVRALRALRAGRLASWQARFERAPILERIDLAAERPGVLVRSLAALARRARAGAESDRLLAAATAAFPAADAIKLLQLHTHLTRTLARSERVHALPDGRLLTSRRADSDAGIDARLAIALEAHLHARLAGTLPWSDADGAGARFLPAANGAAAEAVARHARGDRMALGAPPTDSAGGGDTVRLFLHWHHSADVDLSAAFYDAEMRRQGDCSYRTLHLGDIARHSGDIQNGARGAAEYIDIDRPRARAAGLRYAVATANVYAGPPFREVDAHVGAMHRDGATGAHFEPATVAAKMRLASEHRARIPALLDLETRELIHADLPTDWAARSNLRSNAADLATALHYIIDYADYRPTLARVFGFAATPDAPALDTAGLDAERDTILARLAAA